MAVRSMLSRQNTAAFTRRSLAQASRSPLNGVRAPSPFASGSRQIAPQISRRAFTTDAPRPKKRFRFLRWTFRLTLLSGLGLTGYLAYGIYLQRHPEEQFPPDPNKKTLVILGAYWSRMELVAPLTRA